MTWIPRPETQRWQAPPGVAPWRDLSDHEYEALTEKHGDLSRWYERAPEATKKGKAARTAGGSD